MGGTPKNKTFKVAILLVYSWNLPAFVIDDLRLREVAGVQVCDLTRDGYHGIYRVGAELHAGKRWEARCPDRVNVTDE